MPKFPQSGLDGPSRRIVVEPLTAPVPEPVPVEPAKAPEPKKEPVKT